jgi:hypothetical protein
MVTAHNLAIKLLVNVVVPGASDAAKEYIERHHDGS